MEKRRAAYEAWATAHGLARTTMRGAELAGMVRGRATEMVTGLANERVPTSPEILIRIALPGVEASTLLEPDQPPQPISSVQAMATLLELDGIRDIGVTRGFVRLRFEAFVDTSAFDDALAAFEHALAGDEASPYR
jgi:hypothetical protein